MSRSRDALQLVGSRHQLLVTGLELGPQPDQPQHQPGLGGQPGEQPLLHRGERQAGSLLQPEHPQQLAAVPHRQGSPALARGVPRVGLQGTAGSGPSSASAGQVAASVRRSETVSHTCAHCAPVP